jgi:hypothetical protein
MTRQFFLYRYKLQPLAGNARYTPSFEFLAKYTEVKGAAVLTDELVPESKYRVLPNGEISGLRVGKLEWDTPSLTAFGFDDAAVVQELVEFGRDFSVKVKTPAELAEFLRAYCVLEEREPGLFVIAEASEEFGEDRPEIILDLSVI